MAVNHKLCLASFELNDVLQLEADIRTGELPSPKLNNVVRLNSNYLVNRHRRRYWNYLRLHPAHVEAPKLALQDVIEALTWYYVSRLMCCSI